MKRRSSFTLIEVLLAITIIVMIMGSVYAFYSHSVKMTQMAEAKMQDAQIARVILLKIANELRGVTASGSRFGTVMTGEAERIDFITTAVPSRLVFFPQDITDKGRLIEHDLRLVQYSLARDEDDEDIIYGIRRDELRCLLTSLIEKKTFDKLTQDDIDDANEEQDKFTVNLSSESNSAMSNQPLIKQTILCERIKYLRFDYYDGTEWLTRWNPTDPDAIPKAVKVTIGFTQVTDEEYEHESLLDMEDRPWVDDRYELLVSLILSDDLKAEYTEQSDEEE
jgi:type II secretory pathway pseudopilin PulG